MNMETSDLIKKVRKVEIKTRGLSKHIFSGEYHSAFKGRGMAFSEVRNYQYGDEIRTIDWNVTARYSEPYVKIFEEERELTVMLLIDVSKSTAFGTNSQFKKDLITELSAVLAFSAIQNNDKIGIILFSDKVEKYIPPKKGKSHILRIIRELISFEAENDGTNLAKALAFLNNVQKKKSIAFVISDFLTSDFELPIRIAGKKHDTIALQIYDEREMQLPDIGLVQLRDLESGIERWIDTSSSFVRENYSDSWKSHIKNLKTLCMKNNIDLVQINTGGDYIKPLINFFKNRTKRR